MHTVQLIERLHITRLTSFPILLKRNRMERAKDLYSTTYNNIAFHFCRDILSASPGICDNDPVGPAKHLCERTCCILGFF